MAQFHFDEEKENTNTINRIKSEGFISYGPKQARITPNILLHEETKKCGCSTKTYKSGCHYSENFFTWSTSQLCQKHKEELELAKKIEKEKKQKELKEYSEEALCEICGNHICYVKYFDLEGTYFVCDRCKKE